MKIVQRITVAEHLCKNLEAYIHYQILVPLSLKSLHRVYLKRLEQPLQNDRSIYACAGG